MIETLLFACDAILPIILMIVLGYVLKRIGLFPETVRTGLNRICFRVLIPVLLFRNIYNGNGISAQDLRTVVFVIAFVLVIFGLGICIVRRVTSSPAQQGALLQALFRSNFAVIGLSLATSLFGDAGARLAALLSIVTIPLFNALAVIALTVFGSDGAHRPTAGHVLHSIVTNPLIIGVFTGIVVILLRAAFVRLGLLFRLTDIPGLYDAVNTVANAATPLALLVLGGDFELSATRHLIKPLAVGVSMRLLVVPISTLLLAHLLFPDFTGAEYAAYLALFGTPVAVSSVVMAAEMGSDKQLAGQLVVWTTVFSAVTLFLLIVALRSLGIF